MNTSTSHVFMNAIKATFTSPVDSSLFLGHTSWESKVTDNGE